MISVARAPPCVIIIIEVLFRTIRYLALGTPLKINELKPQTVRHHATDPQLFSHNQVPVAGPVLP